MAPPETTRRALELLKTIPGDVRDRTNDLADDVRETTRQIARNVIPPRQAQQDLPGEESRRFHVRPYGAGWAVEREDAAEVERIFSSRQAALQVGLSEAQLHEGVLIVHDDQGTIEHVQGFGPDQPLRWDPNPSMRLKEP